MIERSFSNKLLLANVSGLYELGNANNPASGILQYASFSYSANTEGEPLPSSHTTYMLQDQIDGTDYIAPFFASEACCLANKTYDIDLFEAILHLALELVHVIVNHQSNKSLYPPFLFKISKTCP